MTSTKDTRGGLTDEQIDAIAAPYLTLGDGDTEHDTVDWRGFARAILAQSAPSALTVLPFAVLDALRFYAHGHHFNMADRDAWDTVSGEPLNFWCDEAGTATVEDGSIAKAVLQGVAFADSDDAEPIEGEVYIAAPSAALVAMRKDADKLMESFNADASAQQAGDGLTDARRTLEWVKEVLTRHIDIDCPSCDCKECEQCGKMPKDCSGTECARTCQCSDCDHCQATGALKELRAILAARRQPGEMGAGVLVDEDNDVETVIACLGDDAAMLREWHPEVAENMDKAVELLTQVSAAYDPSLVNPDPSRLRAIAESGDPIAMANALIHAANAIARPASAQQDEREAEMRAAWKKQTGEEWLGGAGITRTIWAAAWRAAGAVPNGWTLVPISPHIGLLSTGGFYAAAACCEPSITARHLYECVLQEARERYQKEFRMPMPVAPLTAAMSREGDPK